MGSVVDGGWKSRDDNLGASSHNGGNDGSGGGDMLEARVARLESDSEYIKRDIAEIKDDLKEVRKDMREDFRILFGALIVVSLGLAGMMAKGFGWL